MASKIQMTCRQSLRSDGMRTGGFKREVPGLTSLLVHSRDCNAIRQAAAPGQLKGLAVVLTSTSFLKISRNQEQPTSLGSCQGSPQAEAGKGYGHIQLVNKRRLLRDCPLASQ